ncbi:ubiquitin-like-conjugating enzyme ATG10 [Haliotis rubra]|uniref:ubiquitin-like-conjugating enzyme ATG10 n=1 Tax=Haliotis rubra TaxID=36100 RepID=UPI001EE5F2D1|nr:ubiquitin-like-conjugating enzyme ATG10 [Haliotis rubra]
MAAGSISGTEFANQANIFFTLSVKYNDTWDLKSSPHNRNEVYLTKRCNIEVAENKQVSTNQKQSSSQTANQSIAEEEDVDVEESDAACLTTTPPPSSSVCQFEYHIVYSASYGVPVLYFNAYTQDGRLLSLDSVWNSVPQHYQDRFQHERWTTLTQQEHPILGRPFFQLHPCHTADLMSKLIPESCSGNYLLSWLSAVGPVVGLKVPLSYVTS